MCEFKADWHFLFLFVATDKKKSRLHYICEQERTAMKEKITIPNSKNFNLLATFTFPN